MQPRTAKALAICLFAAAVVVVAVAALLTRFHLLLDGRSLLVFFALPFTAIAVFLVAALKR
jgi:hypothetical protein